MRNLASYLSVFLVASTGCIHVGPGGDPETAAVGGYPAYAAPVAAGAVQGAGAGAGSSREGRAAGIYYLEHITGGANAEDALPMIVAFHPRGGKSESFEGTFATFTARARIIFPQGSYSNGRGGYLWWQLRSGASDPQAFAQSVRAVEGQVASAITELRARRPTVGRPVVCGFSAGGIMAFSLAALHPELVSASFPLAGLLPPGIAPAASSAPRPYVHAFHGTDDATNPLERTRASIDELRRNGYTAALTEYPSLGHQLSTEEVQTALAQMAAIVSRPGGP